jgi:hypothetical protein
MTDESTDNESLWMLYSPQPNPWFSSEITYEGWGIATFENPVGTIEGPTKIVVDEIGELKIEMIYKELHTDVDVYGIGNFKFIKFIQGNIGTKEAENMVGFGTGNSNPCSKLIVNTDIGIFMSDGKIFCSEGFGLDNICRFYISGGTFKVHSAEIAKYWAIPLTNFVSVFHRNTHPLLTQHPLRLFLTPEVPSMTDKKQMDTAYFIANKANLFIWFYFGESLGYIQPIIDYYDKEKRLKSGQLDQCITALMVGEVMGDLNDDIRFPQDYINLVSLASGVEVGCSWIEFRDSDGKLVSRKHLPTKKLTYQKEYAVIDEGLHSGLGQLLTVAFNSLEFRKDYYHVLINHLVRLSPLSYHIEDQMALLGRALDALCKEFGIGARNLAPILANTYLDQTNLILGEAGGKLRQLSRQAKKKNLLDESNVLLRLSEKVEQVANNKDGDFGLKVLELLRRYDFADIAIMENYFSEKPKSWIQTLSQYRNIVIHEGYFHIRDGTHDFQEILSIENHLHDLMVRIALKIIDYSGEYQPRVARYATDGKTASWVTAQTTAMDLGYEGEK